jgi:hypothetical protein
MAATIQIVLYLSILIFAFNEMLKAVYVILLALFNDATVVRPPVGSWLIQRSPAGASYLRGALVQGIILLSFTARAAPLVELLK